MYEALGNRPPGFVHSELTPSVRSQVRTDQKSRKSGYTVTSHTHLAITDTEEGALVHSELTPSVRRSVHTHTQGFIHSPPRHFAWPFFRPLHAAPPGFLLSTATAHGGCSVSCQCVAHRPTYCCLPLLEVPMSFSRSLSSQLWCGGLSSCESKSCF